MSNEYIFDESEWSFEAIEQVIEKAREIGEEELGLEMHPMQVEIINAEQMLDMYTSHGLPVQYHHWSFGKHFLMHQRDYRQHGSLAYEMVINSDPCILYCMEDNSMPLQATVLAHAGVGHNAFHTMNGNMREWTNPRMIVDYLIFARNFIAECEEKYGREEVEGVLDACHAIWFYGVDRYKHPRPLSVEQEKERHRQRAENQEWERNILWDTLPNDVRGANISSAVEIEEQNGNVVNEPQENILYFLEKRAPQLPEWKREIIRIVRKIAQHLFPQITVKLMNEGFASFAHYYIMNRFREEGLITDGAFQEFLRQHTNIIFQPEFDETRTVFAGWYDDDNKPIYREKSIYNGKNVYALGFKIFQDIKRMCESPTEEDHEWFPNIAGGDFVETLRFALRNFRDESFILQFLSPKVMRDLRLFSVLDDDRNENLVVTAIHQEDSPREDGYRHVRKVMSSEYQPEFMIPQIEVVGVNTQSDRKLFLRHNPQNRRLLDHDQADKVLRCVRALWEFPVELETRTAENKKATLTK